MRAFLLPFSATRLPLLLRRKEAVGLGRHQRRHSIHNDVRAYREHLVRPRRPRSLWLRRRRGLQVLHVILELFESFPYPAILCEERGPLSRALRPVFLRDPGPWPPCGRRHPRRRQVLLEEVTLAGLPHLGRHRARENLFFGLLQLKFRDDTRVPAGIF